MDFFKAFQLDVFNSILEMSKKRLKDHPSYKPVSETIDYKSPNLFNFDGKTQLNKPTNIETDLDDNNDNDMYKITLRRTKTIPIQNKSTYKRYDDNVQNINIIILFLNSNH